MFCHELEIIASLAQGIYPGCMRTFKFKNLAISRQVHWPHFNHNNIMLLYNIVNIYLNITIIIIINFYYNNAD